MTRNISISRPTPKMEVDSPTNNKKITDDTLKVSGWALNISQISEVNVYIDNKLMGKATYGISREDVYNVYPEYNNKKSGYSTTINLESVSSGNKVLKVEAVGKDGSKSTITRNISISRPTPKMEVDSPTNNKKVTGNTLKVSGWALNASGVSDIYIYIDNILVGKAAYGISREDVYNVYPEYNNKKSGYSVDIDISKISGGTKKLTVKQVGKDGSELSISRTINISNLESIITIDTPTNNKVIKGTSLTISGWTLNLSGVKKVNIYIDNKLMSSAQLGIERLDVYNIYPKYKDKNSGFRTTIDIKGISDGNKVLKVEQIGNDGSVISSTINIKISNNLESILCIDSPNATKEYYNISNMRVSGWCLDDSGIEKVMIYLDGVYKTNAQLNIPRPDVNLTYPGYINGANSGFISDIDISGISVGDHILKVDAYSKSGKIISNSVRFTYGHKQKVIVVDPGHNYGGDQGAFATHAGITYSETDLNMKIGAYLKGYLQDKGYKVIMTRESSDRDYCSKDESLAKRVEIANNSNADAFVSIHQNSFTSQTASGVETYYCNDGSSRVNMSKKLAESTVNKLAANTSFKNRGPKTANFVVIKNTKMPAILVECGFISNPSEAASLANDIIQRKIALSIAEGIAEHIK